MLEIAVVGSSKFVLGFQLSGIRNTYEVEDNPYKKLKEIISSDKFGIVITEEKVMEKLDEHDRNQIESSVRPVTIVLSDKASSDSLRRMIRKSIGIDLWASK